MKYLFFSTILFSVLLVGCDNPADNVPAAKVREAVSALAATGTGTTYIFSEASMIGFTGSKVTGSHNGGFKKFSGQFTVTDAGLAGSGHRIVIDMASTWADRDKLMAHLKSADFFDVEKFPETVFEITELKSASAGKYTVSGNFTLHGITKNISFPATVVEGQDSVKIKADFSINRHDFGISYPGKKDDLIREEVVIRLDLEAVRK